MKSKSRPEGRRYGALLDSRNRKYSKRHSGYSAPLDFSSRWSAANEKSAVLETRLSARYRRAAGSTNFFPLQKSSIQWLAPTKKTSPIGLVFLVGGRGWIRTTEARRNRFTVCPLWPLGNSPIWSWRTESNHQPADYKSAALPIELRQHLDAAARSFRLASLPLIL